MSYLTTSVIETDVRLPATAVATAVASAVASLTLTAALAAAVARSSAAGHRVGGTMDPLPALILYECGRRLCKN